MADAGETTLADRAKPLPVDELLELAVELARAVAGMHHRGVMHRDITPANVVVSVDGVPTLVDFALATSLAETRPEFTHHSRDRGDAGVPGTGADRAHRPAGGSARRPLRPGGDAVRAGHRCAAVRLRRPAAAHPRPPGPGAGATGAGRPGRARTVLRDRHAPAREGAGQPLPDRGGRGPRPGAAARRRYGPRTGRAAGRRAGRPAAAAAAVVAGGPRRARWRRCRRRSRPRGPASAGSC